MIHADLSRRAFLRRIAIGAGTMLVVADAGLAYRAYDQGVLSEGRGPAFEPLRAWPDDARPADHVAELTKGAQ